MFTIDCFHCILDTSPGPQGVHNRVLPLYTGHFTRSTTEGFAIDCFHCILDTSPGPQGVHNRLLPLYTGHFTRSTTEGFAIDCFHCILDTSPGPQGVDCFHCIQDTSPGPQVVHNRVLPLYTGHFTRSTTEGFHCSSSCAPFFFNVLFSCY